MSPFSYLYDPRSDEEVAADYKIRDIPELTEQGKEDLQNRLRELLIKDRQRFRKKFEEWEKMCNERNQI